MKRTKLYITLLALTTVISGCGGNNNNYPKNNSGGTLTKATASKGNLEKQLTELKDSKNNPLFNSLELVRFINANGTLKYATELAAAGFNGKSIYKFQQLELKLEDVTTFKDTPKPNAVIVLPQYDWNGSFENEKVKLFDKEIIANYDTWVLVASTENDVYKAISLIPNIELLILSGHGTKEILMLGDENQEESYLTKDDTEIEKYLQQLNQNAVIFLDSCKTAEGGRKAKNFANFIIKNANGRKIIASKTNLDYGMLRLLSVYPFEIAIIDDHCRNVTYTNNSLKYGAHTHIECDP